MRGVGDHHRHVRQEVIGVGCELDGHAREGGGKPEGVDCDTFANRVAKAIDRADVEVYGFVFHGRHPSGEGGVPLEFRPGRVHRVDSAQWETVKGGPPQILSGAPIVGLDEADVAVIGRFDACLDEQFHRPPGWTARTYLVGSEWSRGVTGFERPGIVVIHGHHSCAIAREPQTV